MSGEDRIRREKRWVSGWADREVGEAGRSGGGFWAPQTDCPPSCGSLPHLWGPPTSCSNLASLSFQISPGGVAWVGKGLGRIPRLAGAERENASQPHLPGKEMEAQR